jgi:uncharacterized Zn-finger protein
MDEIDTETPIPVAGRQVACDGGGGALGHPQVYLSMVEAGEIVCPYCSRRFVLEAGAKEPVGH